MVDLSGVLQQQLKITHENALKLRNGKQFLEAAAEFEKCARLMKELVKEVISDEAKEKRLHKAKEYLQAAANMRTLAASPDTKSEPVRQETENSLETALGMLDQLIGLTAVKEFVKSALNYVNFVGTNQGPGHYIFYGNSGTGKTDVARLMGSIFKAIGSLQKGHLVEVSRVDLVAGYVGQTGEKTRKKLEEALDGVFFLDEAYALTDNEGGSNTFGREAYTEIMKYMDDNRSRLCVIFAGYKEKMKAFEKENEGMFSRIEKRNRIEFPDYSEEELVQILSFMAKKHKPPFTLDDSFINKAREVIHGICAENNPNFGNARAMRNLLVSATVNYSNRMAKQYKSPNEIPAGEKHKLICMDMPA